MRRSRGSAPASPVASRFPGLIGFVSVPIVMGREAVFIMRGMKIIRVDRRWAAFAAMCALSVSILTGAAYAACGCAAVADNPQSGFIATCFTDGSCID